MTTPEHELSNVAYARQEDRQGVVVKRVATPLSMYLLRTPPGRQKIDDLGPDAQRKPQKTAGTSID